MVIPSVGWFVEGEKDLETVADFANGYTQYVHLSFYTLGDAEWFEACIPYMDRINSIHLPNNLTLSAYKDGGLVKEMQKTLDVNLFTVHPWADDLDKIVEEVAKNQDYTLCLENFPAKKSRNGSLFNLLARYGRYMIESENIGLTIDLSHLDDETANYTVVKAVLPYTKIIHMSCRIKGKGHLPIFTHQADVNARNIVGQVLNIENLGVQEVVLEYMKEYKKDLIKHIFWLKDLVQVKRRRFKDE